MDKNWKRQGKIYDEKYKKQIKQKNHKQQWGVWRGGKLFGLSHFDFLIFFLIVLKLNVMIFVWKILKYDCLRYSIFGLFYFTLSWWTGFFKHYFKWINKKKKFEAKLKSSAYDPFILILMRILDLNTNMNPDPVQFTRIWSLTISLTKKGPKCGNLN